ncbi:MAG: gamma-glutamyltransferase, partial [Deltaproteobacteria bacterium]|nr:gamma-glutamyltransferase [Deltaproteobacteria bacterium]
ISATLQTILNALDFGMPLKKAVGSPRIHHQWKPNKLLAERKISRETRNSLARKGHAIKIMPTIGAVQAILVDGEKVSGEADPRKTKKRRGK